MNKVKILAIDDDLIWLEQVPLILENFADVTTATSIDEGLEQLQSTFYDIILLDLNFKEDSRTGLEIFKKINTMDNGVDILVISGETNHKRLIEVFNSGVAHFLAKPASTEEIRNAVASLIVQREAKRQALNRISKLGDDVALVGNSPQMESVRTKISRIVKGGIKDVLVLGETGSGKEVVAKVIARFADPSCRLINVNCAAISESIAESELFGHVRGAFTGADRDRAGAFESAAGGFVFLDEIGDMPLAQQAKLLRVIQERKVCRLGTNEEKPVNFRLVAATNRNLTEAIERGTFREDLFYRIAKQAIELPSLKDRPQDIPDLVHHFIVQQRGKHKIDLTTEAITLLQSYQWPGNIRQLKAIVENLLSRLSGSAIRGKDIYQVLPDVANSSLRAKFFVGNIGARLLATERQRYEKALIDAEFNREKAAKLLGVSRATFFRKAKELGITPKRKLLLANFRYN